MSDVSISFLILALYGTLLLLPLVPTILIYLLFPKNNRVFVKGPLAGLSIKASGAIGAYVLILATVYVLLVPKLEARLDKNEERLDQLRKDLWTLSADIKLLRADGSEFPRATSYFDKFRVLSPKTYKLEPSFGASIVFERVNGEFPNIIIEIPGFDEQNIQLRSWPPSKMRVDDVKRIIKVTEPIIIREPSSGGAGRPVARSQPSADREESVDRAQ